MCYSFIAKLVFFATWYQFLYSAVCVEMYFEVVNYIQENKSVEDKILITFSEVLKWC